MVELSPAFETLLLIVLILSLLTDAYLGWLLFSGRPLLSYRPRKVVPWTIVPALLLVLPSLMNIVAALGMSDLNQEQPSPEVFSQVLYAGFLAWLLITSFIYVLLNLVTGADWKDLGLPDNIRELLYDIVVGTIGFFACVLPILAISGLLQHFFPPETQHPFIEQLVKEPASGLFLPICLSAVIQAPLFEETAFRLVFQGWLEKWECGIVGNSPESDLAAIIPLDQESVDLVDFEPRQVDAELSVRPRLVSYVPHGTVPILVSSVVFALAHLGHGWDPVPLFFLGIVLGYLYHRTHRILPCVILHALFNGFTMLNLWFMIP